MVMAQNPAEFRFPTLKDQSAKVRRRTTCASPVTAREVDWLCPAQYNVFGCQFFTPCWCTKQQWKAGFCFFFGPRDKDVTKTRKMQKKAHNLRKKGRKKPSFTIVCTCGSNTTLKFQIEILIWAGHRRNASFSILCRNHLTYIWNRALAASLGGWRIG